MKKVSVKLKRLSDKEIGKSGVSLLHTIQVDENTKRVNELYENPSALSLDKGAEVCFTNEKVASSRKKGTKRITSNQYETGLPIQNVVEDMIETARSYICYGCNLIPLEPITTKCGHIMCSHCTLVVHKQNNNCPHPLCGSKVFPKGGRQGTRNIQRMDEDVNKDIIDMLRFECRNLEKCCTFTGSLTEVIDHYKKCEFGKNSGKGGESDMESLPDLSIDCNNSMAMEHFNTASTNAGAKFVGSIPQTDSKLQNKNDSISINNDKSLSIIKSHKNTENNTLKIKNSNSKKNNVKTSSMYTDTSSKMTSEDIFKEISYESTLDKSGMNMGRISRSRSTSTSRNKNQNNKVTQETLVSTSFQKVPINENLQNKDISPKKGKPTQITLKDIEAHNSNKIHEEKYNSRNKKKGFKKTPDKSEANDLNTPHKSIEETETLSTSIQEPVCNSSISEQLKESNASSVHGKPLVNKKMNKVIEKLIVTKSKREAEMRKASNKNCSKKEFNMEIQDITSEIAKSLLTESLLNLKSSVSALDTENSACITKVTNLNKSGVIKTKNSHDIEIPLPSHTQSESDNEIFPNSNISQHRKIHPRTKDKLNVINDKVFPECSKNSNKQMSNNPSSNQQLNVPSTENETDHLAPMSEYKETSLSELTYKGKETFLYSEIIETNKETFLQLESINKGQETSLYSESMETNKETFLQSEPIDKNQETSHYSESMDKDKENLIHSETILSGTTDKGKENIDYLKSVNKSKEISLHSEPMDKDKSNSICSEPMKKDKETSIHSEPMKKDKETSINSESIDMSKEALLYSKSMKRGKNISLNSEPMDKDKDNSIRSEPMNKDEKTSFNSEPLNNNEKDSIHYEPMHKGKEFPLDSEQKNMGSEISFNSNLVNKVKEISQDDPSYDPVIVDALMAFCEKRKDDMKEAVFKIMKEFSSENNVPNEVLRNFSLEINLSWKEPEVITIDDDEDTDDDVHQSSDSIISESNIIKETDEAPLNRIDEVENGNLDLSIDRGPVSSNKRKHTQDKQIHDSGKKMRKDDNKHTDTKNRLQNIQKSQNLNNHPCIEKRQQVNNSILNLPTSSSVGDSTKYPTIENSQKVNNSIFNLPSTSSSIEVGTKHPNIENSQKVPNSLSNLPSTSSNIEVATKQSTNPLSNLTTFGKSISLCHISQTSDLADGDTRKSINPPNVTSALFQVIYPTDSVVQETGIHRPLVIHPGSIDMVSPQCASSVAQEIGAHRPLVIHPSDSVSLETGNNRPLVNKSPKRSLLGTTMPTKSGEKTITAPTGIVLLYPDSKRVSLDKYVTVVGTGTTNTFVSVNSQTGFKEKSPNQEVNNLSIIREYEHEGVPYQKVKKTKINEVSSILSEKSESEMKSIRIESVKSLKSTAPRSSESVNLTGNFNEKVGQNMFRCHICKRQYKTKKNLFKHIDTHSSIFYKNTMKNVSPTSKSSSEENFHCIYEGCGKVYSTFYEIEHHMQTMHAAGKNYLPNGVENIQTIEKVKSSYKCRYCSQTFITEGTCKLHTLSHTGDKQYKCKACPQVFFHPYELKEHEFLHTLDEKVHSHA